MRAFVILACICAVAYGQNPSSFGQNSGFGSSQYQRGNNRQYGGQQNQAQQAQNQYQQNQNQYQQSQNQYQQTQNQYQQTQNQYQQQPASRTQSAGSCRETNERTPVSGSCDRYIECINGTSEEKLCPDGLRFNPNVNFEVYPCQYPNDVPCLERSSLQPPQPTADCPHQFGYFKLGDSRNCSAFRNCVNGVGFDFTCPEGLAFNPDSYRCDWPDEAAECDAEAFLGFRCPEVPTSRELGPPAGFRFYKSDISCQKYFVCIDGRPRALVCGGDSAFDELTSACVSADQVATCPAELRASAVRARDEENQRLAKQLEFDSIQNRQQHKRRF